MGNVFNQFVHSMENSIIFIIKVAKNYNKNKNKKNKFKNKKYKLKYISFDKPKFINFNTFKESNQ